MQHYFTCVSSADIDVIIFQQLLYSSQDNTYANQHYINITVNKEIKVAE